ncbi:MAG: hypothetical protein HDR79_08795 [Bacteroides sp.]|nr:hypothetical protein [Bacteroides sp.]
MGTGTTILVCTAALVGICAYSYHRYQRKLQEATPGKSEKRPQQIQTPTAQPKQQTFNQAAAKSAFFNNLPIFIPLLHTLTDGTYEQKEVKGQWDDEVIDINNADLINLWHIARKNANTVKHILAQWGLTPDLCTEFQCMPFHLSMYQTSNGAPLVVGTTYTVESPCWVLSNHNSNGQSEKTIILKGVVK